MADMRYDTGYLSARTSLAAKEESTVVINRQHPVIIPLEPELHKYGMHPADCFFGPRITWQGEPHETSDLCMLKRKLNTLPLKKATAIYMAESKGYFFSLSLRNNVDLTISQYEDEMGRGAYVNVSIHGEVVLQDYMPFDNIVNAIKDFYDGAEL